MRWFRKPMGAIPNRFDSCTLRKLGPCSLTDKAVASGAKDWRFDSSQGRR